MKPSEELDKILQSLKELREADERLREADERRHEADARRREEIAEMKPKRSTPASFPPTRERIEKKAIDDSVSGGPMTSPARKTRLPGAALAGLLGAAVLLSARQGQNVDEDPYFVHVVFDWEKCRCHEGGPRDVLEGEWSKCEKIRREGVEYTEGIIRYTIDLSVDVTHTVHPGWFRRTLPHKSKMVSMELVSFPARVTLSGEQASIQGMFCDLSCKAVPAGDKGAGFEELKGLVSSGRSQLRVSGELKEVTVKTESGEKVELHLLVTRATEFIPKPKPPPKPVPPPEPKKEAPKK